MQCNQQLRYGIDDNPHRRAFKLQRVKRRHNPFDFAVRLRDCDFHPRLQSGEKIPRRQHQNTVNKLKSGGLLCVRPPLLLAFGYMFDL